MKKLAALFLLVSIIQYPASASYLDKQIKDTKNNHKYNSVKYHQIAEQDILNLPQFNNIYKDPLLINLKQVEPINISTYNEKLKADNLIYETKIKKNIYKKSNSVNIEPAPVDFYNVYRICERLIRANNLDYINWRIAIRKSPDYNASSFDGNAIMVHTGLYDSLYSNNDALAFVFAHEMAHQLFGHSQRKLEARRRHQRTNATLCLAYGAGAITSIITQKMESRDSRLMEFMTDAEAMRLLVTAGYDPQKAMQAVTFMQGMPNIQTFWESHPIPTKRISNLQEYARYINPYWVDTGKANICSSEVLKCKKSSDRVSIVINKSPNINKYYKPETQEECITRIAYISYKTGDMEKAVKYFNKLAHLKEDYASYIYLSYANQYLYEQTNDAKYKKASQSALERANHLRAYKL